MKIFGKFMKKCPIHNHIVFHAIFNEQFEIAICWIIIMNQVSSNSDRKLKYLIIRKNLLSAKIRSKNFIIGNKGNAKKIKFKALSCTLTFFDMDLLVSTDKWESLIIAVLHGWLYIISWIKSKLHDSYLTLECISM